MKKRRQFKTCVLVNLILNRISFSEVPNVISSDFSCEQQSCRALKLKIHIIACFFPPLFFLSFFLLLPCLFHLFYLLTEYSPQWRFCTSQQCVHISTSFGFAGFTELQMIMLTESYRSLVCPQGHCTVNEWMRQNMYQCLSRMVFW